MPDPFDFDEARRALDDVPAPDLWDEATRRASAGTVATLDADDAGRGRRPLRWLAAAVVAVVAVGTSAVFLNDDDQRVDSQPAGDLTQVTWFGADPSCSFGITGEAPPLQPGFYAGSAFGPSGMAEDTAIHHGVLGDQPVEVSVPGQVVTDLVGERVEDIELERGSAQLWVNEQFVQVRWFPDAAERCESFTVTVYGESADAGRHAGVALAERMLLASDGISDRLVTIYGDTSPGWCRVGVRGGPVEIPVRFGPATDRTSFPAIVEGVEVRIEAPRAARFEPEVGDVSEVDLDRGRAERLVLDDVVKISWVSPGGDPCDSFSVTAITSTEEENRRVATLMANRIVVESELPDASPPARDEDPTARLVGEWQLERSTTGAEPTDGGGAVFIFTPERASWSDGCNTFDGPLEVVNRATISIGSTTDVTGSAVSCPSNLTADTVALVMGADEIDVAFDGPLAILAFEDVRLVLRPLVGGDGDPNPAVTDDGFAIWPETVLDDVPLVDAQRRSGALVATRFAREVLGWEDATIDEDQGWPSEYGRPGSAAYLVVSPSRTASVEVTVAPARPDGPEPFVYVVYRVNTPERLADPDATASVLVVDGTAQGGAGPTPAGTTRTRVRFAYGEDVVEGTGEAVAVSSDERPGSVLVIWEGVDGVLGAWGTTLPQGDFAAG